ncbi:MAG: hypothetical protein Q9219_004684 [cf. Caloplaca sp. 3 TL-2023]
MSPDEDKNGKQNYDERFGQVIYSKVPSDSKPESFWSKVPTSAQGARSKSRHRIKGQRQKTASLGIVDLCQTISNLQPSSTNLGYLTDMKNRYLMHSDMALSLADADPSSPSLQHILSKTSPIALTRRERYGLALTIAASHIKLYGSLWLDEQWMSQRRIYKEIVD